MRQRPTAYEINVDSVTSFDPIFMADIWHQINNNPNNAAWDILSVYAYSCNLLVGAERISQISDEAELTMEEEDLNSETWHNFYRYSQKNTELLVDEFPEAWGNQDKVTDSFITGVLTGVRFAKMAEEGRL